MPRKAPAIEPKEDRDAILSEIPPYVVTSKLFYDAFRCDSRETRERPDGKTVVGKRIKGDSINLAMIYMAFANHASSETHLAWPTYGRIATLLRISPESVKRGLKELYKRGLLKFAYRKPNQNGEGFVNVVRVIHDKKLSKADEDSIASYPQAAGHPRMSAASRTSKNDLLGKNSRTSLNDQQVIEPEKQATGEHPGRPPLSRSSLNDHGTVNYKNIIGHGLNGTNAERLLDYWIETAKTSGIRVTADAADLEVAQILEQAKVPEERVREHIRFHYELTPEHTRLRPVVSAILAHVQSSNGR